MKRQHFSSITIMLATMSGQAMADSGSDLSVEATESDRIELSSEADSVDRRARRRSGQQGARAANQAQSGPSQNSQAVRPNQGNGSAGVQQQQPTPPTPGVPNQGNGSSRVQQPTPPTPGQSASGHQSSTTQGSNARQPGQHTRQGNTTASHARPAGANGSSQGQARSSANRSQRRPSTSQRPAPHNRPAASNARPRPNQTQVRRSRHLPPRWAPNYHRYHLRGVARHHPRYWSAGVFYYNPPPQRNNVVIVNDQGNVASGPEPTRAIDRTNSFAVGISAGSYNSGYETGGEYGDMGIGLTATYRPVEAVGFELAWTHYDQSWDETSERIQEPVQASVNLYAFPWTRVSPYVTLGLTQTGRDVEDTWFDGYAQQTSESQQTVFGPHVGMGAEFALGRTAALDLEARYINYLDMSPGDASASDALQGTMGLKFYF